MNIVRENRDNQSVLIRVTVSESDYGETVEKNLREYRRKANIPGFRPGMVPMGLINKMYRKGVVAEESYKAASEACFEYIEKEKINYVGGVIPAEEQKPFDPDNNTEHEFDFEIGLAPEINLEFGPKDKVTEYRIKADKTIFDGYRSNFLRRYGKLVEVEEVASDEALSVTLDNEQMNIEDAYVGLISMSEEERKPFIGKKVGDKMQVDVNELYKTPAQRAAILKVKEDELEGIDSKFELTITKIRKFAEPELNEEFFKEAFPDGSVTDEKGLEGFLYEQIARDFGRETDYLLSFSVRKMLIEKAALAMPEAFIRRWLFVVNEEKFPMEEIEKGLPEYLDMMRWDLIRGHLGEKLDVKIEQDDATEEAKKMAREQFAQYGMAEVPEEMLSNYAAQMLADKEQGRKVYEKLFDTKVIEAVTPMLKVTPKEVSVEEFNKIAAEITNSAA